MLVAKASGDWNVANERVEVLFDGHFEFSDLVLLAGGLHESGGKSIKSKEARLCT